MLIRVFIFGNYIWYTTQIPVCVVLLKNCCEAFLLAHCRAIVVYSIHEVKKWHHTHGCYIPFTCPAKDTI